MTAGITGSVDEVNTITVGELKIADLYYKMVSANLIDLGHIENRRGIKVLGLIGFEKLKGFEMEIDLNNDALRLYRIDEQGNRIRSGSDKHEMDYVQRIEVLNSIAFVNVTIAGKSQRFCLDSAAETNALSSTASKPVLKTFTVTRTALLKGAGSTTREVLYGTLDDFEFGNTRLNSMTAILSNLEHLSDAYGLHLDGILGYDFFIMGTISLNFVKKQMGIRFHNTEVK